MFKRFAPADDISSKTAVKSSVQRGIKKSICDEFPEIEAYMDDIIPKKADVLEGKGKDRTTYIIVDDVPLFFKPRDGAFFPTLRLLHKYPTVMPRIQVDAGAIRFVLSGANIMAPGVLSAGGAIPVELPEGAPVAVYAQGKEHALAVGTMSMSTEALRATKKGTCIEVLHHLDDMLWHNPTF